MPHMCTTYKIIFIILIMSLKSQSWVYFIDEVLSILKRSVCFSQGTCGGSGGVGVGHLPASALWTNWSGDSSV